MASVFLYQKLLFQTKFFVYRFCGNSEKKYFQTHVCAQLYNCELILLALLQQLVSKTDLRRQLRWNMIHLKKYRRSQLLIKVFSVSLRIEFGCLLFQYELLYLFSVVLTTNLESVVLTGTDYLYRCWVIIQDLVYYHSVRVQVLSNNARFIVLLLGTGAGTVVPTTSSRG